MPTYKAIYEFENQAQPATIRLVKSGEFYRAYNHSAWLFCVCISEYKVMRKYAKAIQCDLYYIGFPTKSLTQIVGDRKKIETSLGYDIELDESELPDENLYSTWQAKVHTDHSTKGDYNSLPISGLEAERVVLKKLKECHLEDMTMVECAVFLAELRKLLRNN